METDKINLRQLTTSLLAVIVLEFACGIMISMDLLPDMVLLGMTRVIQTAAVILIAYVPGKGLSSIGLGPSSMTQGLKMGIVWSVAFGALVGVVFVILLIFGIDPLTLFRAGLSQKRSDLVLYFLVGGFIGPIAEEAFFRGMVYGFFRRWGAVMAMLISASLFAFTHLIISGIFAVQFIGGILFAASYEREKSLITPITIHVLGNLAIFTLSLHG